MTYMLDTNICSYILRERPLSVKRHFETVGADSLAISTVVLAELFFGAARHPSGKEIRREIDDFVSRLTVLPWDKLAATHYGEIRADLERSGKPIGAMDLMIAAHARSISATLVTNNAREFERVFGLHVENWV